MAARFLRLLAAALIVELAPFAAAGAQSLTSGGLEGVVTDGATPVGGARVVLADALTGSTQAVTTPFSGTFSFSFLPPGDYSLLIEHLAFQPRQITGVPVTPGRVLSVAVALTSTSGAAEGVDSVVYAGSGVAALPNGVLLRAARDRLTRYPERTRTVADVLRFTTAGPVGQGLPLSMSEVRVAGQPISLGGGALGSLSGLRNGGFFAFDVLSFSPDVEWSGTSGGGLNAYPLRGGRELSVMGSGFWDRREAEAGGSPNGGAGTLVVSGPIVRDTSSFLIAIEAARPVSPVIGVWSAGASVDPVLAAMRGAPAVDSDAESLSDGRSLSILGNLDWRIGSTGSLAVRTHVASTRSGGSGVQPLLGGSTASEGTNVWASVIFGSQVNEEIAQEFRFGLERSGHSFGIGGPDDPRVTTYLGAEGLRAGEASHRLRRADRLAVELNEAVTLRMGEHRLKLGLSAGWEQFDREFGPLVEFYYSSAEAFGAGLGYFAQTGTGGAEAAFSMPRAAVFAQDTWTPAAGVELTLGLRHDVRAIRSDDFDPNAEWLEATALADTVSRPVWHQLQPRAAFTWDIGDRHEWVISGAAGLFAGMPEPDLIGEALAYDQGSIVRRGAGSLGAWPATPSLGVAPEVGLTATFAAPGLAGPRTFRAAGTIRRSIGPRGQIFLAAVHRYTDLIPRRADLNLAPAALAVDRFGEPVYGELNLSEGLLTARAASNRRFGNFDRVYALNADGWSRYMGLTAGFEVETSVFDAFGTYTFSRTSDSWIGDENGMPGQILDPRPGDPQWLEGTSDLDRPHSAVLGLAAAFGPVRGSALYAFQSGDPFTPGYRAGFDFNGDGVASDDPAFVDSTISGVSELAGEWDCLESGAIAERNACRSESVSVLDARLEISLVRSDRIQTELVVDALNLLDTTITRPDRALYLLQEGADLTAAEGMVTVPLVANPGFGEPLLRFQPGRMFRLGLRVSY